VSVAGSRLGRILVDGRGRTLYLFEKDVRGRSACAGTCAVYWPPLLTNNKPTVGAGAKRNLLGVTRRSDGTRQVTYAGHPLYRFVQDTRRGQTNGQDLHDFGAGWYVLSPAGQKVERDGS
jgi:predicted lipoprotein with Yx(FWY)xxD motif